MIRNAHCPENELQGCATILLKAPDKLDEDGKRRLQELLCCNIPLYKVYTMREQFRPVFTSRTVRMGLY